MAFNVLSDIAVSMVDFYDISVTFWICDCFL